MDFFELLKNRHDELSAPLQAEKREKQKARAGLRDPKENRMLDAQIKTLEWELEKARACGNDSEADQYEREGAKVLEEIQHRNDEVERLTNEIAQIDAELKQVAQRALDELFPQIREVAQEYWIDAMNVSAEIWEALQHFAAETGARASAHLHRRQLVPSKQGSTRQLRKQLIEWVG